LPPLSAGVIKTIICEIVEECVRRGHSFSETLAGFMVKAVVLNPTNGFDVDQTLSEEDVQRLKQVFVTVQLTLNSNLTVGPHVRYDKNLTEVEADCS
uniref:Cilia- and flagella-associated protein 206 n=1 Tax=Xiphophorus couchianus TaxID=32473 RepID=A0A3B5LCY5_9TELE